MVDNGFKTGFANALQSILEERLPGCGIKATPHITSRIKTLKRLWQMAYDMVYGPNTSGFGWDLDTKFVTAEPAVWEEYLKDLRHQFLLRGASWELGNLTELIVSSHCWVPKAPFITPYSELCVETFGAQNFVLVTKRRMTGGNPSSGRVEVNVDARRGDNIVHRGGAPAPPPASRRVSPLPVDPDPIIRDSRPFKRWFSWLVPCFVAANIAIFIITMFVNNCPKHYRGDSCFPSFLGRLSFQPLKENPLFGPSSSTLEKMGALEVDKVVHRHQAWRLISCMWLHAGVIHVLANMLSLLFIGIRLEQEFGFVRIGLLYLISGFGGSLLSALFIQSGISVGASGALFGLLGGMLSELLTNWTIYANKCVALSTLIVIIIINLALGVLPHVDNFAHIGGFISGFLLGFVFLIRPQFKWVNRPRSAYAAPVVNSKHKPYQYMLWVIAFILVTAGLITGLILLLRGVNLNDYCSWCHYLSCVPTSKWSCKSQQVYCESTQMGNQLNMTCLSNGRSHIYPLSSSNPSQVQQLCSQLCN
ncbi:hypothetical protein K1719_045270 [Acacia pycnantha]|nr:hypothetical protein K1719_045270 [Acacia pycnantha]